MSEEPRNPLVTWRGNTLQVAFTKYAENGNTCIVLINAEGQIELKASVNLGPQPAHICFVKDYSENRGVLQLLLGARLLRKTGHSIRNGSEEFVQCELTPWACSLAGIESPKADTPFKPAQGLDQSHGAVPSAAPPMTDAEIADEPDSPTDFASLEAVQNAGLVEAAKREAAERAAGAVPEDVHTQPAPEDIDAALVAGAAEEGSGSPEPVDNSSSEQPDDQPPPAAA